MKDTYVFEYVNENEFRKLERSIKKYNMLAYKQLYFQYYPELKNGKFLGEVVSEDEDNGTTTYELKLTTDAMFSKVHGDIKLYYLVYHKEKIVMLDKFEPLVELLVLLLFVQQFSVLQYKIHFRHPFLGHHQHLL